MANGFINSFAVTEFHRIFKLKETIIQCKKRSEKFRKMNKLLVLLCVLLSFSLSETLELTNICGADHFEYNGVLVNSVFLSNQSIQLKSARSYLMDLDENCGVEMLSWETTKEFYKIKRD